LKEFEIIEKHLQSPDCTMTTLRAIFDAINVKCLSFSPYLAAGADTVHSPGFKLGIGKVIDGDIGGRSNNEKEAVKIFCNEQQVFEDSEVGMDIVKSPIKNKKRKVVTGGEYCDLSYFPPSSNIAERVCCNLHGVLHFPF
jgi:hypothetical protein